MKPQQNFLFFTQVDFTPGVLWKRWDLYFRYFDTIEYMLRIKISQMRERGRSQSFLKRAKFYAEWNNYSYATCKGNFFHKLPEGISFTSRSMKIRTLVKVLILTTWIYFPWVLRNNYFLHTPNFRRF